MYDADGWDTGDWVDISTKALTAGGNFAALSTG